MLYEIPLEQSLIFNFFSSNIYFVFETTEEKDSFLNFIALYDERFTKNFNKKDEIKAAMWKFSPNCHHHQVEWQNDVEYFRIYGAIPVSYGLVMKYANMYSKIYNFMNDIALDKNKGEN